MTRLVLLLCVVGVATSAAPAGAATVRVRAFEVGPDGTDPFDREDVPTLFSELRFTAGKGERNRLTIRPAGGRKVRVTDRAARLKPGSRCRRRDPHTAICRLGVADVPSIDARLGDRGDRMVLSQRLRL